MKLEVLGNIYKEKNTNNFRMFPGDPMGLPDDFFSKKLLDRLGRF